MRRLALVFVLATACKTPSTGTATPGDRPQAAARRSDPELAAVADRIDPGPQRPIYELLPQWLKAKTDADGDPRSPRALAEAREAIAGWDRVQRDDQEALLLAVQRLGRGLVLAERAVAAGSDDPELLAALAQAYQAVAGLEVFRDYQTFMPMVQAAVARGLKEENVAARQIYQLAVALNQAIDRAPVLHLHVAARLLREHPDHPTIPATLATASEAAMETDRHAEGVALRKLAVGRRGDRATGVDFVELARVCYVGLDLPCGDLALETAEKRGAPTPAEAANFATRLRAVDATAETARKIAALAASDGLEAQVERGHLLLQLNRRKDAEATFAAAHAAHPKDARPLAGLAATALQLTAAAERLSAAAEHLRAARGLENRDRRYYEVALGTLPEMVFYELTRGPTPNLLSLDASLAELGQLIDEFRPFDPARAAVLELLLTVAREATPKLLGGMVDPGMAVVRKLPERALVLTRQFPESRDAWMLVFASVRLTADAKRARAQVTTPLPAALSDDPGIRLQQARALLDIALMWEDRAVLAKAVEAAASLPAGVDADVAADLRATLDAVRGRQGDRAASERAAAAFAALAQRKTGREKALALNNQAMAVAQTGEVKQALELLTHAQLADVNVAAASCNTFALAFDRLHQDGASNLLLAQLTREADSSTIRMHAQAWRVAIADAGYGDGKTTREQFAAMLAEERRRAFLGTPGLGRWGVAVYSDFKLSFAYSPVDGLVMVDEVPSRWWQFAPAPTFDALLAAKGGTKPAAR